LKFASLPTGRLEDAEKLEQLRALEHGIPIRVWETTHDSLRVDTPGDVELVAEKLQQFDVIKRESDALKAVPSR
jgi:3-deoxy-manno-octulosonate cytidylyltransferase (CMP-KDO synthetase)